MKTGGGGERTYTSVASTAPIDLLTTLRPVSTLQENTVKVAQYSVSGSGSSERFWIKSFQSQEILLKVK